MALVFLEDAIFYFSDPVRCREYLIGQRWPNGVECPRCGSRDVLFLKKYERWYCRAKHKAPQFTLKTGTLMEDSPIKLEKWLPLLWYVANYKHCDGSHRLSRALSVTQKTAWFMLRRIRLAMEPDALAKINGDDGPAQIDEVSVGGKVKRMRRSRCPKSYGTQGGAAKTPRYTLLVFLRALKALE